MAIPTGLSALIGTVHGRSGLPLSVADWGQEDAGQIERGSGGRNIGIWSPLPKGALGLKG